MDGDYILVFYLSLLDSYIWFGDYLSLLDLVFYLSLLDSYIWLGDYIYYTLAFYLSLLDSYI